MLPSKPRWRSGRERGRVRGSPLFIGLALLHRAAAQVEAGYVWINDCSTHIVGAPFGGYKQSGMGREESKDELFEFTQVKNINVSMV